MKRLMFLIFLLSCMPFLNVGCSEQDLVVQDDTEINGGNNDDGESEDGGNVNPNPPDEFIEEQAREKLGYAYPEEHFYIDVSGTD